jgi:hypothetical protein
VYTLNGYVFRDSLGGGASDTEHYVPAHVQDAVAAAKAHEADPTTTEADSDDSDFTDETRARWAEHQRPEGATGDQRPEDATGASAKRARPMMLPSQEEKEAWRARFYEKYTVSAADYVRSKTEVDTIKGYLDDDYWSGLLSACSNSKTKRKQLHPSGERYRKQFAIGAGGQLYRTSHKSVPKRHRGCMVMCYDEIFDVIYDEHVTNGKHVGAYGTYVRIVPSLGSNRDALCYRDGND